MSRRPRIAVLTNSRFHVLDLARELSRMGWQVSFHSYVPRRRSVGFGLPAACHRSLLPVALPFLALLRLAPAALKIPIQQLLTVAMDIAASYSVRRCDAVVAMSGMYTATLRRCRRRHDPLILVERGSRHICSQAAILDARSDAGHGAPAVPTWFKDRECRDYQTADRIMVPSQHTLDSFTALGVDIARLCRMPYGVDLRHFPATPPPPAGQRPTILMVGAWSWRKGCDVLLKAWLPLADEADLVHVGAIGDLDLPQHPRFRHIDPVDQRQLTSYYERADLFVLLSREEGMAMVLFQALASGVPIVCTERSGGADLAELTGSDVEVTVIPTVDADRATAAMRARLLQALARRADPSPRVRLHADSADRITWSAYGRRYDRCLRQLLTQRRT